MDDPGVRVAAAAAVPRREARFAEFGAAWLGIVAAVGFSILRASGAESYDRNPTAVVAFGVVYAMPGILALAARRDRPFLYLASGLIYMPLTLTAMSGIALPLLIPAVMAFIAFSRHADEAEPRVFGGLVASVVVALGLAAFFLMFVHQDPRCVSDADSTACTGDIITNGEGALSLAASGLALTTAWILAAPTRRRTEPGSRRAAAD